MDRRLAGVSDWLSDQWLKRSWFACLLWPISFGVGQAMQVRRALYRQGCLRSVKVPVPVIVVGNIYVGGTGKTPMACALASILQGLGYRPGLVSRGYGSQKKTLPATGRGIELDWQTFGDEPVLIARKTGMAISSHPDRVLAAKHLLAFDPSIDVILSDDGLQHLRFARDCELLIEDERGLGNGWTLPAGPLREPASRAKEAAAIFTRDAPAKSDSLATKLTGTSVSAPYHAGFTVEIADFYHPASGQVVPIKPFVADVCDHDQIVALAAIGVPERFFRSLRALGLTLHQTHALIDHAPIAAPWLNDLAAKTILMTEKDAVKLSLPIDPRIWVARTDVRWETPQTVDWIEQLARRLIKPNKLSKASSAGECHGP
jgi:tetraacyldisaccharide 4'-kinase